MATIPREAYIPGYIPGYTHPGGYHPMYTCVYSTQEDTTLCTPCIYHPGRIPPYIHPWVYTTVHTLGIYTTVHTLGIHHCYTPLITRVYLRVRHLSTPGYTSGLGENEARSIPPFLRFRRE